MSRLRCEDLHRLAISEIDCRPAAPAWQYPPPAKMAVSVVDDGARIVYDHMDIRIAIDRTRCNYGGERFWWRCPTCQRRCGVLYGPAKDGGFGCRICLNLGYASDTEDKFDRMGRKQRKLEGRLGVQDANWRGMGRWTFVAAKPKWMRWWTYDAIQLRIAQAKNAALRYLTGKSL